MKIKMYRIENSSEFMNLVNSLDGNVFLVSNEGDRLNLKSTLTQYLALAKLFNCNTIDSMELEIENSESAKKLIDFMMMNRH